MREGSFLHISLSRCTVAFVGALKETKKSLFLDSPSTTCLVENAENIYSCFLWATLNNFATGLKVESDGQKMPNNKFQ